MVGVTHLLPELPVAVHDSGSANPKFEASNPPSPRPAPSLPPQFRRQGRAHLLPRPELARRVLADDVPAAAPPVVALLRPGPCL